MICLMMPVAERVSADKVTTIRGETLDGRVESLDAKRLLFFANNGEHESISKENICSILLDKTGEKKKQVTDSLVVTVSGSRLSTRELSMELEKFRFENPDLGKFVVPAEKVLVVFLPGKNEKIENIIKACDKYGYKHGNRDYLIARDPKGELRSLEGVLKKIGTAKITFHFETEDRTVSRSRVPAIFLAELSGAKDKPHCRVELENGDILRVGFLGIADGKITADETALGEVTLGLDVISAIHFDSDKVVGLSDMKPVEVKEYGFFDVTFKHRMNQSVGGEKMVLAGKTYSRGIGMHSFSELAWDLDGKYSLFLATAGIDDLVRPKGNAGLKVIGDGKVLFEHSALTGRDKPVDLKVDVSGVSRLKIQVNFGEDNLGVSDYVDIASPRLVK